jgi:hypothetical protein
MDNEQIKQALAAANKIKQARKDLILNPPVKKDWIRPDGTMKDVGYYGKLKSPMGQTVTEYSIPATILGKEMDIPSLVPGLTEQEKQHILEDADKVKPWDKTWKSIENKAIQHATQRAMMGINPFYSSVEDLSRPVMSTDATKVVPQTIFKK